MSIRAAARDFNISDRSLRRHLDNNPYQRPPVRTVSTQTSRSSSTSRTSTVTSSEIGSDTTESTAAESAETTSNEQNDEQLTTPNDIAAAVDRAIVPITIVSQGGQPVCNFF